jgi:hypothetical protein
MFCDVQHGIKCAEAFNFPSIYGKRRKYFAWNQSEGFAPVQVENHLQWRDN